MDLSITMADEEQAKGLNAPKDLWKEVSLGPNYLSVVIMNMPHV